VFGCLAPGVERLGESNNHRGWPKGYGMTGSKQVLMKETNQAWEWHCQDLRVAGDGVRCVQKVYNYEA